MLLMVPEWSFYAFLNGFWIFVINLILFRYWLLLFPGIPRWSRWLLIAGFASSPRRVNFLFHYFYLVSCPLLVCLFVIALPPRTWILDNTLLRSCNLWWHYEPLNLVMLKHFIKLLKLKHVTSGSSTVVDHQKLRYYMYKQLTIYLTGTLLIRTKLNAYLDILLVILPIYSHCYSITDAYVPSHVFNFSSGALSYYSATGKCKCRHPWVIHWRHWPGHI